MHIPLQIAERAFAEHGRKYGQRIEADPWDVAAHAELWVHGRQAVERGDSASFVRLHSELRSYWGVGRGKNQQELPPSAIHDLLQSLPMPLRSLRLSKLEDAQVPALFDALGSASAIKRNSEGPSIMAMSKYLHFMNPRLFVIVDRQVMWSYVLNHDYLWKPIEATRDRLRELLPTASAKYVKDACDVLSYAAILRWCGDLMRANPDLPPVFHKYLSSCCGEKPCPEDAVDFEAAAAEWLLLGLVEIPPYAA